MPLKWLVENSTSAGCLVQDEFRRYDDDDDYRVNSNNAAFWSLQERTKYFEKYIPRLLMEWRWGVCVLEVEVCTKNISLLI